MCPIHDSHDKEISVKKSICAAAAVVACAAVTSPVLASSSLARVEVNAVRVTYDPAKAQTPQGARALYAQLRSIAADVCVDRGIGRTVANWGEQKCAAAALDKAVADVNLDSIDTLHDYRRGIVELLASR
jgi:UrcA family protein